METRPLILELPPTAGELSCWKCGASLAALTLPLRRLEECPACGAELHVCRLCEFHATTVARSCREPVAEEVKEKTRANFCDYFKPRRGAWQDRGDGASRARLEAEALFGSAAASADAGTAKLSPEEEALARLESLFGPGKG